MAKIEASDQSDGKSSRILKQTGIDKWFNILLCRSDLNNETLDNPPVSFTDLFKYASPHDRFLVWTGILLAVLAGIGQPLSLFFAGQLANILILYGKSPKNEELWDEGYRVVLINTITGLLLLVITFAQYFCLKIACQNITAKLRFLFVESMLRQDAGFYDQTQLGTINSQLNESINLIRDGIAEKIGLLVRGVSMFFTTIILSLFINWRITMVMIVVGPCSYVTMSSMAIMVSRANKKRQPWLEAAANILQESIMNVRTVQSCNGQAQMAEKYSNALNSGRIYGIFTYFWNGFFDGLFFLLLYTFYGLGLCYGVMEFFNNKTSASDVLIVTNCVMVGSYLLGFISPHIMAILKSRVAAATIYAQIERIPDIQCHLPNGVEIMEPKGNIQFKDVDFEYPSRRACRVLKKVSLEIEAGQCIALVGPSGSGKSSCVALLNRLYECTGGQISIDGVDIKTMNIRHLRKIIGTIEQHPVLFSCSIFDNIALGDTRITEKQVVEACKIANANEFIERLPEKYRTVVGFNGLYLSGGQIQRIAIARAIVKNPKILLLDEATSALDAESEILVQSAMSAACRNRTTIIIAHKLSTLRDVEKIVVLSNGEVVETGSHTELMQVPGGLYANLVKMQQFEQTESENLEQDEQELETFRKESFTRCSIRSSLREPTASNIPLKEDDVELTTEYSGLLRLYGHSKGHYVKLLAGTLFSLVRGLELPIYVLLMNLAYLSFQNKDADWDEYKIRIFWIFMASIGLALLCCLTIFGAVSFFGWAAEEISDMLKIKALKNVLRQNASFFDRNTNAQIVKSINSDGISIKAALDNRLYHFINNVFSSILELILAFFYSIQVSIAGTLLYTVLCVILWFLAARLHNAIHMLHLSDDSAKLSVEIIEHARTIQLSTRESYFLFKYQEALNKCRKWEFKIAIYDAITFSLTQSSMYLSDSICYAVGIWLIYYGYNDSNQVFVSSQTMSTLSWGILFISLSFTEILHAIPSCNSLCQLVDVVPTINDHELSGKEPEVEGKVSIQNAFFAYPNRPLFNVLNGLTINADKGQMIALVGPSGSGKSTLISLLERFYELKSGELLVDKTPVHQFKLSYLRNKIALVSQHPVLFTGTIFENICLGVPNPSMEDVIAACKIANANEFIERLPDGYETQIGPKQLSGGQRQRLIIARATIRKPTILLLDESTSALDTQSERHVQAALLNASNKRTCVVIAHRLSSVERADKIYFIADGRVKEAGTHLELLKQNGLYAAMVRKQNLQN